jgi:anhydro-N-acetylmuramic acid kinase
MTGTSMDGLDLVLCRIEREAPWRFELLASASEPMADELRDGLAKGPALTVAEAARLGRRLGEWYATATDALARREGLELDLVGMHGQTVYHEHGRVTVQLGEASFVAERLGCPVVSDFRQGDIAVGGCGAPLVPIVDSWLLGRPDTTVLALNIGGIANLTLIPPDADPAGVIGFDCGPGNMVIDELARRLSDGAATMDRDGALAAQGTVRAGWLARLLAHPFFAEPPPRSTGREQFGAPFVDDLLGWAAPSGPQDWQDLIATATQLTVEGVAGSVGRFARTTTPVGEVVASGGGARNKELMRRLQLAFPAARVVTSDARRLSGALKEAIAFALLASARIDEIPTSLPSVTGGRRAVLLGKITEV